MHLPKISIITTYYNSVRLGNFVEKSMVCLLSQTYKHIEFICVNDGSTDETLEQLKEYAQKDSRIILVDKKNEGVAQYAKAAGQEAATGDFIMLLDHDDKISDDAIAQAVDVITSNPEIDAVSMLIKVYYSNGKERCLYQLNKEIPPLEDFEPAIITGAEAYGLTVGRYDFHFRGLIVKEKFKAISYRYPEKIVNGDEIVERQIIKTLDKITSCKGVYHHYIYENSSAKSYHLKKTDLVRTDVILRKQFKNDGVYDARKGIFELIAYKNLITAIKVYHHFEKKITGTEKNFYLERLQEGFRKLERKTLLSQFTGFAKLYHWILTISFSAMYWFYRIKD